MGMMSKALKKKDKPKGITIPDGILASLEDIARNRGVPVSTIIEIVLTGYVNAIERGKVFTLRDHMPFGKYKDQLIEDVIRVDSRYIGWLYGESDIFKLDDQAIAFFNQMELCR